MKRCFLFNSIFRRVANRTFSGWHGPNLDLAYLLTKNMEKGMNKFTLVAWVLLTTGCAGLAQTGSISKAYATYDNGNYTRTLKLITQAKNISEMTPELSAELTYLTAKTYSKLGQDETANALFEYLKDQRRDSPYSYLASKKLAQQ